MNHLLPPSLQDKVDRWREEAKPWIPHEYQGRALKFMLENSQSGLLLDPGLGKTSITLAAFKILLSKKLMRRALVIAPLRATYDVWPAEMSDWKDFHSLGLALLHGDKKERLLRDLRSEHQVVLINPEGLQWLMTGKERMRALGADTLVVDESSKFKSANSQRSRMLRAHLASFQRRYILTGSPRPKNYMDLYGQIFILDRGAALGSYVSHYRNNFFYPTGYNGYEWAPLPDSAAKINALIAPMVMRLDAADYLKLPKVLERTHYVDLPPAARKEYDAVEDTLMSTLFSAPLVNSAAARSKCAQMANGSVYLDQVEDDGRWPTRQRRVKVLHTAKVEAMQELYEELQGEPLLLAIGFHHDVEAIRAALGRDLPVINSATTKNQAAQYIEDWNKGRLGLLMIHPASAGHALNLQKFSPRHVGFYYVPDDYDHFDQAFRRVWRQGNKATFVMRHMFVARDTVDVAKVRNLERKGNGQRDFLAAMREYDEERRKSRRK